MIVRRRRLSSHSLEILDFFAPCLHYRCGGPEVRRCPFFKEFPDRLVVVYLRFADALVFDLSIDLGWSTASGTVSISLLQSRFTFCDRVKTETLRSFAQNTESCVPSLRLCCCGLEVRRCPFFQKFSTAGYYRFYR